MAAASYAQFIAAIAALSVSGVTRKYSEPPQKMNVADIPCSFLFFPSGDNVPLSFTGGRQFPTRTADLIVVHAQTATTADQPFTATVAMMDAVETALKTLEIGNSKPTWRITSQLYDETTSLRFWAVIATVSGTG